MHVLPDRFAVKTAFRDARTTYRSLLLYFAGIVAGVAALVSVLSFRSDVLLTVDMQARELLGADLEITSGSPHDEQLVEWIDSLQVKRAEGLSFSSMVLFQQSAGPDHALGAMERQQTRLSQIRAIRGGFPFYGALRTSPESAAHTYQSQGGALLDRSVMTQLGLQTGDSLRVGTRWLPIVGELLEFPGESAAFSLIGPRVVVPLEVVENSELLDRGSRAEYKIWLYTGGDLASAEDKQVQVLVSGARERSADNRVQVTTVERRKQDFELIINQLTRFLGMVAFIALMLGGLGVASAVYVYIRRKSSSVATLRCLGVSTRQILQIYALQVAVLGMAGALAGIVAGLGVQRLLPLLFVDFLPFDLVQRISVPALLTGFLTGALVSQALAVLPLLSLTRVPPLLTLRSSDLSPLSRVPLVVRTGVLIAIWVMLAGVLSVLLDSLVAATVFVLALTLAIALLLGLSLLLIQLVRALRLSSLPWVWRQGIANMFRPNNQTPILITTTGMGMLLVGVMYLSQEMILQGIDLQTGDNQPNLVFYDIQPDQEASLAELVAAHDASMLELVPIVSMRLSAVNGRQVRELRADTTREASTWALTREYRVSFRSELNESESILEGEWVGDAGPQGISGIVPISLDHRLARDLAVGLSDTLLFDIQGVPVTTTVASIREVDFQQPRPNFFVLFPAGALEPAPRFSAMTLRTADEQTSARLQQAVVREHPNISAIDVGLVLQSVRTFLDKVAMAVQFMAFFSILTGLIVLASSVAISRFQRIREAVLLRTLGSSRSQIRGMQFVEYLWLGSLACLAGLLLAYAGGWALAFGFFDLVFTPDLTALALISTGVVALTLLTGFMNSREVFRHSPLEILRTQADRH